MSAIRVLSVGALGVEVLGVNVPSLITLCVSMLSLRALCVSALSLRALNILIYTYFNPAILVLLCGSILLGCHPRSHLLEPNITYTPQKKYLQQIGSHFDPLSSTEIQTDWGRELKIGISFALDGDYYRAITAFRRSEILAPEDQNERRLQSEYSILLCYYLGKKYSDAIEFFEESHLTTVTSQLFPPFRDMLVILYDCYSMTCQEEKATAVLKLLEKGDCETAFDLRIFSSVVDGEICMAKNLYSTESQCEKMTQEQNSQIQDSQSKDSSINDLSHFLRNYCHCTKSVKTAQTLNAILPGAGYYYVGQKKTALTSFIINASFIAASHYFFKQGNWGAGLVTTSLEFGWYFGGINGAGLAAKQYNECIYNELGKEFLTRQKLFPVLMLERSF